MSTDAQPAASSAAPPSVEGPPSLPDLGALSPAEYRTWQLTGKGPDAPAASDPPATDPVSSEPPPAESAPAPPAEQAASTDAQESPASEPGKPSKGKSNAETRIKELLRERHELQQRLAAYEAQLQGPPPAPTPPAASSPATGESFPTFEAWIEQYPDRSYEAYIDARAEHAARQAYETIQREAQQRAQAEAVERERAERIAAFQQRYQAAVKADPTFVESLSPTIAELIPVDLLPPGTPIRAEHIIAQEIIQSEHPVRLMRYLSEHPEEYADLLGKRPGAIIRHIGRLDATFDTPTAPPPTRTVSHAPPPPPMVGTRPAVSADPVEAAIQRGDVEAYIAEANRRELAALKG